MSEKLVLSNADLAAISAKESTPALSFLYGATDRLSFGLGLQYTLSSDEQVDYVNALYADYSTTSQGLNDPTIFVKGRIFGSQNQHLMGNMHVAVSPGIIEAKSATKTTDGTMGKGGTDVQAGIEIGTPLRTTQVSLSLNYTMRSDRTTKDADTGDESKHSGGNALDAGLSGQVVLTPGTTGALFYSFQSVASREIKQSGTVSYTEKDGQYTVHTVGIGLASEISENDVITATYSVSKISDIDFDISTGSTGVIKDIKGSAFNISWLSRF